MMKKLRITIGNKSYDVTVEDLSADPSYAPQPSRGPSAPASPLAPPPAAASSSAQPQLPAAEGAVTSPMAGVIKSVLVSVGQEVKLGESLLVLEAMKMENHITAPRSGVVRSLGVKEGDSVLESHVLVILE